MKQVLVWSSSLLLLLSFLIACGGESQENAFPKKTPVDERTKKEQIEALSNSGVVYKDWDGARQNIESLLEGSGGYYQTNDGTDAMTAEYTTYYLEEEEETPIKTQYTYKTGGFDLIYWLPDGQVWLEKNGYSYLIEGEEIVKIMREGEEASPTATEQKEALALVAKARTEISPVNYTL